MYDSHEDKISEAGFLELTDAKDEDYSLWELKKKPSKELSEELKESELKIIYYVGKTFEQLWQNENRFWNNAGKSNHSYLFIILIFACVRQNPVPALTSQGFY